MPATFPADKEKKSSGVQTWLYVLGGAPLGERRASVMDTPKEYIRLILEMGFCYLFRVLVNTKNPYTHTNTVGLVPRLHSNSSRQFSLVR